MSWRPSVVLLLLLLNLQSWMISVKGGCCNDNYWCDGDPRYLELPDPEAGCRSDYHGSLMTWSWVRFLLPLIL